MIRSPSRKRLLLVCDLDNTLYDWMRYFVPAFYAMVETAIDIVKCDRDTLLDDFRAVHQRHHDSEHPFALLETRTIRNSLSGKSLSEMVKILDPAFHAFNSVRKQSLRLHEGVALTLERVSREGTVVAHTESKLYAVVDRLRRLGIHPYFHSIYCRERSASAHPDPLTAERWLNEFPMDRVVELSRHQTKPSVDVLLEICLNEQFSPSNTVYVGDSIARDVLMAKRAGVYAVWAAYGTKHDPEDYARLVRISHWTTEDIEREQRLRDEARSVKPDYTCHRSFSEVLGALEIASEGAGVNAT